MFHKQQTVAFCTYHMTSHKSTRSVMDGMQRKMFV